MPYICDIISKVILAMREIYRKQGVVILRWGAIKHAMGLMHVEADT